MSTIKSLISVKASKQKWSSIPPGRVYLVDSSFSWVPTCSGESGFLPGRMENPAGLCLSRTGLQHHDLSQTQGKAVKTQDYSEYLLWLQMDYSQIQIWAGHMTALSNVTVTLRTAHATITSTFDVA